MEEMFRGEERVVDMIGRGVEWVLDKNFVEREIEGARKLHG